MRRFLYDTAVFVYALGAEHPYREPCRAILKRARRGELAGEASVELLQELANVQLRRGRDRRAVVRQVRDIRLAFRIHDFEVADVPLFENLLARHKQLKARDAVFAATALNRGIDAIVSPDRDFDGLRRLERIDPLDAPALASLEP